MKLTRTASGVGVGDGDGVGVGVSVGVGSGVGETVISDAVVVVIWEERSADSEVLVVTLPKELQDARNRHPISMAQALLLLTTLPPFFTRNQFTKPINNIKQQADYIFTFSPHLAV
jgi:hypothetical protein